MAPTESIDAALIRIQSAYPRIYLACHTRHQTAPVSGQPLSPRDASILAHLDERDAISQGVLARHLGIAKSTLSEALKHLERQHCIRRVPDPADPRGTLVYRSPEGTGAMSQGSVLEAERLRALLSRLTQQELVRALDGLELLARAAVETPKSRRSPA
jgi:DNA-binding MarR family transcriptional regulator